MDLDALVNIAADHLEAGDGAEAERVCLQILETAPKHGVTWANLSYAYILQARFEEAKDAAERAVTLDPMNAVGWHNLGESHLWMKQAEEALTCQNRALVLDANMARIWLARGSALLLLNRYATARLCFEKALSLEPEYRGAQLNLQVAQLLSDENTKQALQLALGIAVGLQNGELDQNQAAAYARKMVKDKTVGPELVRQFDAMIEINERNPEFCLLPFAWLNALLAHYLEDQDVATMARARFEQLQSWKQGA